ncbi:hypothetical protein [Frigoriflavimonas asaccharolytica]|uniref:Uncharacterized protein n=1 Tax=Frigoriflavimonas asaccharolytica TaxID=2735899 RepID=A0A8J8G8V9_9FLAO|nr:hypothetical protein [Frigoriflavimonas asaccharolytica]NRS91634.1 hypothetical protein [Frigoriflavimonas asaccharolytica]
MKKLIILCLILMLSFSYGQKNLKYIEVGFSSICCGTPSSQPIIDYIKNFQKQNKLKNFEIWKESGLGYEGEYALYIGIDQLNKRKKALFLTELKSISETFNKNRNNNHDGYINIGEVLISKESIIKNKEKPRNRFSKTTVFKY